MLLENRTLTFNLRKISDSLKTNKNIIDNFVGPFVLTYLAMLTLFTKCNWQRNLAVIIMALLAFLSISMHTHITQARCGALSSFHSLACKKESFCLSYQSESSITPLIENNNMNL